jgi:tetratricopeptide (TPR) repeat protein
MKKNYFIFIFVLFLFLAVIFVAKVKNKDYMSAGDYVLMGNQMGIKGNHFEASRVFKSAMNIDPHFIPAYLGLGIAYGNLDKNAEAIEVFKEGIKLDKLYRFVPQMQMSIASIAYEKMNDDVMAVKYIKKALQSYTNQGNHGGVAMAAHKLKQISPDL